MRQVGGAPTTINDFPTKNYFVLGRIFIFTFICRVLAILQYTDSSSNFILYEDTNVFVIRPANNESISKIEDSPACHYNDRPSGWSAFLVFNFTVMFILPLLVSYFK